MTKNIKAEFPEMSGFSVTNLKYCKLFYNYRANRPQVGDDLNQNLIFKLPWGHIKLLINKIKDSKALDFYLKETVENNWSRDVLELQIKSDLFKRQGNAISNFGTLIFSKETNL